MAFITIPLQVVKWVFKLGKEENRRFIAEVIDFPGVLAYGNTKQEAVAKVQALALRVLADKLEHGEVKHTYKIFEEIKDREAYYQNMMWVFDLQKKYDKQQLKFFKMREKKIFKYSPLEDYDEVSFTFGVREISEIELEQIKINDNYSQIEEVFMQMIRPIKTLLAVRSGSQNVDIAFDLGGDLIFLVNSYKNNQVDDIPHVIVFYGSHVHGSKMHDVDKIGSSS